MRMIGPDFALFIVGALLFAGATYGLVTTEGGLGGVGETSNVNLFAVTWKANEQTSDVGAFTEAGAALDKVSAVNGTGIEKVVFVLSCNDPNPAGGQAGFSYTVEVTGVPEGLTAPAAMDMDCTDHEMEIVVQSAPKATQVNAADANAAKAEAAKLTNATGSGDYGIRVTGSRSNSLPSPGPVPKATVNVEIKVVTYAAEVAAVNVPAK